MKTNKSSSISKARVRGDITDPKIFNIVGRFKSYKRKTAENIIEMGRVVIEAKSFPIDEYHDFCLLIGYDWTSSTVRKLESIGNKYEYLISKSDNLPTNWTVLYEISRLGEDVIEDYIQNNKITPQSTGSAIDKLLIDQKLKVVNKKSKSPLPSAKSVLNRTSPTLNFIASIVNEPSKEIFRGLNDVFSLLNNLGFTVTISMELRDAINNSKTV